MVLATAPETAPATDRMKGFATSLATALLVFRRVGCRNLRRFMQWPIGGFPHESGVGVCEGSWDSSCGDFWDGSEVAICDSYCDGSCKVVVTDQ